MYIALCSLFIDTNKEEMQTWNEERSLHACMHACMHACVFNDSSRVASTRIGLTGGRDSEREGETYIHTHIESDMKGVEGRTG